MRILGVDPGLTRCGIGVIDVSARRNVECCYVGVARSSPDLPLQERLGRIGEALESAFDKYQPDAIAFERVYAGENHPTGMSVAQVTGIVMYEAHRRSIATAWYTPTQVKAAVSSYGQADKSQVQLMVQRILKLDTIPKPADAADALAIAICHAWSGASARAATVETDAQRKWRDAERQQRRVRRTR